MIQIKEKNQNHKIKLTLGKLNKDYNFHLPKDKLNKNWKKK